MTTFSSDVTAGNDGTATQYNNLRKDVVLGVTDIGTETDGATITVDWSEVEKGKIRKATLGGNRTIDFSNMVAGQSILLILVQDATGSRTVTYTDDAIIKWANGGTPPTLTTTANAADLFAFTYDGTNFYGSIAGLNYI